MTTRTRILTGKIESSFMDAASAWLQQLAAEFGIGDEDVYRIDLCFEELVMNTISYAEPAYQGQRFDIKASVMPQRIVIDLLDAAQPYDPFAEHKPQEIAQSLEDLKIGGHGITFVKEYSDACRYEYVDGRNHIELIFDLAKEVGLQDSTQGQPRGVDRRKPASETAEPAKPAEEQRSQGDRRSHGVLSRADIFRGVPYTVIEQLVERFPVQQFASETTLLSPGDPNDQVFIVLAGSLRIGLGTESHGEFFDIDVGGCVGEMSVIDNRPASAYIIANPSTRLMLVDGTSFVEDFLAIPRVSRNLLSALAERLRRHNDLVVKRVRLEADMEHMQRELGVAKEIQESLLPKEPLFAGDARIDCMGRMNTAKEVGGDFYDVFFLDKDNLFFVIGDVCGKGLPAALFMVRAVSALRAQSCGSYLEGNYVSYLIASLNAQLCTCNDKQQFLTAFCGILNVPTGTIHYLNAGHNPPLITGDDGKFFYVSEPINPIVGMIEGLTYQAGTAQLPADGVLFLYTDGVTEAEAHDTSMYDETRLIQCLNAAPDGSAAELVNRVFADVEEFVAGAAQSDDITVLAIRRCG